MKLSAEDRATIVKCLRMSNPESDETWIEPYDERVYRAGLRAGLERAAKVCDAYGHTIADNRAAAIRALLDKD